MEERPSPLPPYSRPDEQSLRFPAGRPAMPARPAGVRPGPAVWLDGRRKLEAVDRMSAWNGRQAAGVEPNVRTDLALEAFQLLQAQERAVALPGVEREQRSGTHATVHRVKITSPQASEALGKAPGTYSTVEAPGLRQRSQEAREEVGRLVAEELQELLRQQGVPANAPVLVAGLGNWNATPDSLGPRVVGQLLVTRHLHALLPPERRGSLRPVAAISPGVLGLTGIETSELVSAVARQIGPAAVICVDALAAGSPERLCTTVQLADSGIQPGAGVGNVRRALSRRELGIPVIAIGVPTVIHARRIAQWDGGLARRDGGRVEAPIPAGAFPPLMRGDRAEATPMGPAGAPVSAAEPDWVNSLIVTPKEIDVFIDDAAELLAGAINTALHPGLDLDEVLRYIQ